MRLRNVMKTICLMLFFALSITTSIAMTTPVKADTPNEVAYDTVWVHDFAGFVADGASIDSNTLVATVNPYTRFGYSSILENVVVKTKINFSVLGNFTLSLRNTGTNILDAGNTGWTNRGYYVRFYPNARYDFVKNSTVVHEAVWPPFSSFAIGTDYVFTYKTVNMSDGSVKISVSINDVLIFEHIDSTDMISGNWFVISSEGATFTASGHSYEAPIVLNDVVAPTTSPNFPATIRQDNSGIADVQSGVAASGVAYTFQSTEFYSHKFKYTPVTAGVGSVRMTIGAYKTNAADMNRDDVIDAQWGWAETGYTLSWSGNGQRHLFRNGALIEYVWHLPTFEADRTYDIEYGIKAFTGGNRIHLKIDGALSMVYFDKFTTNNTPVVLPASGTPGSLVRSALIMVVGNTGTIAPSTSTVSSSVKTLGEGGLGTASSGSLATFDRNGGITTIPTGIVAGYDASILNNEVKVTADFDTIGTSIVLQSRSQGTLDTPNGAGWTNPGYVLHIYPNGQAILLCGGVQVCEGWSLSSVGLAVSTDADIVLGTINLSDTVVRVYATINGQYVVNYVDSINAITTAGWFVIHNTGGFSGEILPYDTLYPTIASNIEGEKNAIINDEITLSYSFSDSSTGTNVLYYIDSSKSTTTGNIVGDKLTIDAEGTICVYAKVDGVYSNDLLITATDPSIPKVTGAPTTIVYGSSPVTVDAVLGDDTPITTKTFSIVNVTGEATIDETTGVITPIKAGTIKVYATVNGKQSTEDVVITILPVVTILDPSSLLLKNDTYTLEYDTNCPLPSETITPTWAVTIGSDVATINPLTGEITPIKTGEFSVVVTLTGESFTAVSTAKTLKIVFPEITNIPASNVITGNYTIGARMSDDSVVGTKVFAIENATGEATIDETTGVITPVKAGTIKVYATVDGVVTEKITLVIKPTISITPLISSIIRGTTKTLEYTSNYPINEDIISTEWEIVSGGEYATIVETTGLVTAVDIGTFRVKVTITTASFEAISSEVDMVVAYPTIIDLPVAPVIFGDSNPTIDAVMSDGSVVVTKVFGITCISGEATINAETGVITPVKAGTVKVYATVNGIKSDEYIITIIPKVFINKEGSFALGGVYDMDDYYSANCPLPTEDIDVIFEIVSGDTLATLDSDTNIITVLDETGIVSLRVTLVGDTFEAVSPLTNIAIEQPIILTHTSVIGDMYIGEVLTLDPQISQGGFDMTSLTRDIIAIEGASLVEITGLSIRAVSAGTFKFKVRVDGRLSTQESEIAISALVPTIIANEDMGIGGSQPVEIMVNATNYDYTNMSVTWSITSGDTIISISSTTGRSIVVSGLKKGTATLQAVVQYVGTVSIDISVHGEVILQGVSENQEIKLDSKIQLSYREYSDDIEDVTSVQYVVIRGADCITISDSGEVQAIKAGTVTIKVVVNGIDSDEITFTIYKPTDLHKIYTILTIIMVAVTFVVLLAETLVVVIAVKKRVNKID